MKFQLKLTGLEEVDAVLMGLPLQLNHRVLQAAHAESAKVLVSTAKQLSPKREHDLEQSIGIAKVALGKSSSLGEINVGPRRGKFGGNTAHLNEFGTRKRATLGKGQYSAGANRGVMPAHPFMEPAWEQTKNNVVESITENIVVKLSAFMRRTIKKHG